MAGWKHRIVEKPSATNEFRFLRLAWRAAGEVEAARAEEPLLRLRARLLGEGVAAKVLEPRRGQQRQLFGLGHPLQALAVEVVAGDQAVAVRLHAKV